MNIHVFFEPGASQFRLQNPDAPRIGPEPLIIWAFFWSRPNEVRLHINAEPAPLAGTAESALLIELQKFIWFEFLNDFRAHFRLPTFFLGKLQLAQQLV